MVENRSAPAMASTYGLSNSWQRARERLDMVEAWLDPGTIRGLEGRGVGEGWRCLEVGAGGGSIAAWLSARVGSSGQVLAVDIDTRFLSGLEAANLEVRQADIRSDDLPAESFDLAHCRLLLMHLTESERMAALRRIVAALRPGGWLVAEEMHFPAAAVDPSVTPEAGDLFARLLDAHNEVLAEAGFDAVYGSRLLGELEAQGLADLEAEGQVCMWRGASVGAAAWRLTFEQLAARMVDGGHVSEGEIAEGLALFDDPRFRFMSQVTMTVRGRRPGNSPARVG
ncbi:MAG: class I SAM-dependent methyltransferase [Dehalococcoidia bacterium]